MERNTHTYLYTFIKPCLHAHTTRLCRHSTSPIRTLVQVRANFRVCLPLFDVANLVICQCSTTLAKNVSASATRHSRPKCFARTYSSGNGSSNQTEKSDEIAMLTLFRRSWHVKATNSYFFFQLQMTFCSPREHNYQRVFFHARPWDEYLRLTRWKTPRVRFSQS